MSQGYFRYPAILGEKLCFTSEDDLWEVPVSGGSPRRLTAGLGTFSRPHYSPDGQWIAFSSAEEGHTEVYVMPAEGGEIRRLTYLATQALVVGWLNERTILFSSSAFEGQRVPSVYQIGLEGGLPTSLKLGPAVSLAVSASGKVVLERNSFRPEPAFWRRYRGGTAGKLWYAPSLESEFKPLISLNGNLARPMWVGEKVYFVSDHEGHGHLYSCSASGEDLRRETFHKDFYVRNPSTDGKTIVYAAGADLYRLEATSGKSERIEISYTSQRTQRQRRFVEARKYLESAALDHKGENVSLVVRGQIHSMPCFEGPVGTRREAGSRFRLSQPLNDGVRLLSVTDTASGEERLEVFNSKDFSHEYIMDPQWGRFTDLNVAPKGDYAAFSNHRNELWLVNLNEKSSRRIVRNEHQMMGAFHFSPDGRWLAFSHSLAWNRSALAIADVTTGEFQTVTKPLFNDFAPNFSVDGKYLFFLSKRVLNPVYDELQFELSFPKGCIPCLITLNKETVSPFLSPLGENENKEAKEIKVEIDFDGIQERILAFPMPEAKYAKILALKEKVMLLSAPVEGALDSNWLPAAPATKGILEAYDFKTLKVEPVLSGISDASLSGDGSKMLVRVGNRLRVLKAGEKPEEASAKEGPGRKSGWLNLERVKALVEPASEWKQMLNEVWRLQRDHFWREDMSKINWQAVLQRYLPLVDRVNTRSEFGDLVWEMQGELGTSHAYDIGGDYRIEPNYAVGLLGADFSYDSKSEGYRIERLIGGDAWRESEACPLRAPGVLLEPGDVLVAINGVRLNQTVTPNQLLLHLAGSEVNISVLEKNSGKTRQVRVRTLKQELPARYRDWVEQNREYVRKTTMGRVGYVHIPDMGPHGFAEFHRHFLRDFDLDALIVDVRYNGGGHVSQLLLEKLCRQRMGADESRWFGTMPFPDETPAGPMVALTNEYAGSDGDIFSHSFKLKKAGPLIGRRTWGGVVGIWPRHRLVDGGVTTQPEFSHWFSDVGWQVENYGTDPDIDVDIAPHDYRKGFDPQLDRGIQEVLKRLEDQPPFRPVLADYPDLGFELM